MLHVYTGDGKGKTTAAFGLASRARGSGLDVCIVQFMKGTLSSEIKSARSLGIDVYQFGRDTLVDRNNPHPDDLLAAQEGLEFTREAIKKETYDLMILDEVNVAIDFNLLLMEDILELVIARPATMEMVLTGRNARAELINLADYVTEMKEVKHPYHASGIPARKGIEY